MKFITRDLYQSTQPPADPDGFELRWKQACDALHKHLGDIREKLPPGMRSFVGTTLHDGVVLKVDRPDHDELILEIDATRNPWGPMGFFRLRFTGVKQIEGVETLVGDDWLYEETHLHADGAFEYCILFWRSDFRVVADEVQFEPMPADTPSAWKARGKKQ